MTQHAEPHNSKVFISQVLDCTDPIVVGDGCKVWLQGMVTSIRDAGGAMLFRIDDSTGCIDAKMTHAVRKRSMNADECYNPGAYVLVTGKVKQQPQRQPVLHIHRVIDLSAHPDREAIWILQVIEAQRSANNGASR